MFSLLSSLNGSNACAEVSVNGRTLAELPMVASRTRSKRFRPAPVAPSTTPAKPKASATSTINPVGISRRRGGRTAGGPGAGRACGACVPVPGRCRLAGGGARCGAGPQGPVRALAGGHQRRPHRRRVGKAVGRVASERPEHDVFHGPGDTGPHLAEPEGVAVQPGQRGGGFAVGFERWPAAEGFVEDHAERVQVGTAVDRAALHLFGCDVLGGADHDPVAGEIGLLGRLGDAEVGHQHPPVVGQQDVRRLHVAVHDAAAVGGTERVGDLGTDAHDLGHLERSVLDRGGLAGWSRGRAPSRSPRRPGR